MSAMHDPVHALAPEWDTLIAPPASRAPPPLHTVVAVAHPDDETIAIGASMPQLRTATFVYATDGAPRRLGDARAAGFGSCGSHARARRHRQCFRPAPAYDFERPPHAGPLLYDALGRGLTGAHWRRLARSAPAALGLAHGDARVATGGSA